MFLGCHQIAQHEKGCIIIVLFRSSFKSFSAIRQKLEKSLRSGVVTMLNLNVPSVHKYIANVLLPIVN